MKLPSLKRATRPVSGVSAWVVEGEQQPAATPWRVTAAERRPWWWWVVRGLVVAGVALVVVVVVVQLANPSRTATPAAGRAVSAPVFPEGDARAVASRYVEAFYTWDEADPSARAAALAVDVPDASDSTAGSGWDGKGHQVASQARAVSVLSSSRSVGRVVVVFRLVRWDSGTGQPGTPVWVQASVAVAASPAGSVAVTGLPGLMPVDRPVVVKSADRATDDAVAASSKQYISDFFTAYAGGADVSAASAPGARIRGLAGAVRLVRVDTWQVWGGSGPTRAATAGVTWEAGGAQFSASYDVTLTETTANGASKWLVSQIAGSN